MSSMTKEISMRRISYFAVCLGVLTSLLGAIWSPEDSFKWVLTGLYLLIVGKYFGITFRSEKVKGTWLKSPYKELNILNLRRRK